MCTSCSYCYINQARCCVFREPVRNWPYLHFLHFMSYKEVTLREHFHQKLNWFIWFWLTGKKNNLTQKISLLLMKANVYPRDFLPPDKRRECLYRGFLPSDWQDRFCLFSLKGDFQTFDRYLKGSYTCLRVTQRTYSENEPICDACAWFCH